MGGGGSWCFLRLVEEVKLRASNCQLQNEDVYMNTTFQDFIQMCVRKLRGEDGEEELLVDYVSVTQLPGPYWLPMAIFVLNIFAICSGGEEHQQHDCKNASSALHRRRICGCRGWKDLQDHQSH